MSAANQNDCIKSSQKPIISKGYVRNRQGTNEVAFRVATDANRPRSRAACQVRV